MVNIKTSKTAISSTISRIGVSQFASLPAIDGHFINLVVGPHEGLDLTIKKMFEFILDDLTSLLFTMETVRYIGDRNLDSHRQKYLVRALIEHFHTQARSIFDYLVPAIITAYSDEQQEALGLYGCWNFKRLYKFMLTKLKRNPALKLRQFVRQNDFYGFRRWILQNERLARTIFGSQLVDAMKVAEWFPSFNKLRNDYTHRGAYLEVIIEQEPHFLFREFSELGQPAKLLLDQALIPKAFYLGKQPTNQYVNFRLYAGLYFACVFGLVEEISSSLYTRLGLTDVGLYNDMGISTAKQWMSDALASL